jgi:glutamate/tyrosine decarboxylase-like PLP-dependent enzyme
MPESTEDTLEPYQVTPQWSRRMIGLKVFMSLAELGRTGYARMVERQANLAEELRRRLVQAGWVIKNETPLPVVCFTRREIECGSITTEHMVKTMNARGRVWISDVVLGGRERVLRACITSYRCDRSDIDCLIDELDHARRTHDER